MVRRDRDLDMGVVDLVAVLGGSHGGGSHTMVSLFLQPMVLLGKGILEIWLLLPIMPLLIS
jgi:hypothetical protein